MSLNRTTSALGSYRMKTHITHHHQPTYTPEVTEKFTRGTESCTFGPTATIQTQSAQESASPASKSSHGQLARSATASLKRSLRSTRLKNLMQPAAQPAHAALQIDDAYPKTQISSRRSVLSIRPEQHRLARKLKRRLRAAVFCALSRKQTALPAPVKVANGASHCYPLMWCIALSPCHMVRCHRLG